ncbi:MAG: flagellar biosynthetic protein FliR [Pseudobdellovibrionaceae bacterium]
MFPGLSQFPEGQIIAFALVFLRIIAFVVAWPVFGSSNVPVPVKVLLSLIFSIILFPVISFQNVDLIKIDDQLIFLSIREVGIGLALGFLMRMFFFAISIAGEVVSLSIGLSSAQMFNPTLGTQSNVVEQFQMMIATLFFLAINGHHIFITGMAQSFDLAPVAVIGIKAEAFGSISQWTKDVFVAGLKMSAPVLVAIFLTNISMGILGRAVPQINVLVTSMAVTLLLGLGVLFVTTPLFLGEMHGLMNLMAERFFQFMKVI